MVFRNLTRLINPFPIATTLVALAAFCVGRVCWADEAMLLDQLTGRGVSLTDRETIRLAPPSIDGSMDKKSRQQALSTIAGGIGWERFSRKSVVAPIEIDLEYVRDDDGRRIGHLVYVAFVAHCELDQLRGRERIRQLMGWADNEPDPTRYGAEEISEDQFGAWNIGTNDRKYAHVQIPLLDRILVHAVIASQHQESGEDVNVSWEVDPGFGKPNAQRPWNHWSRLDANDSPSQPYQGAAGYVHVTRLDEPAESCFVEARMVIHEPTEWFRGSNLLRSKLPLLIQESVRKFRRQLNQ